MQLGIIQNPQIHVNNIIDLPFPFNEAHILLAYISEIQLMYPRYTIFDFLWPLIVQLSPESRNYLINGLGISFNYIGFGFVKRI